MERPGEDACTMVALVTARLAFGELALKDAGEVFEARGDPETMAKAEEIVRAHVASHPELMAIPATERQAAHASH